MAKIVNTYLLYLEWPERCFRLTAADLACFRALVPAGSRIVRVRSDAAFLKALPQASHVVTWHFRAEWFARSPRLKLLATPAAGRELLPTLAPPGVRLHFGHFHGAIIAETVIGYALAWTHGLFEPRLEWPRARLADKVRAFPGSVALVVGYGHVGRAIGERFRAFGAKVYGLTRHGVITAERERLTAAALWRRADWLVLALPGDTGTDDYLDARRLARLKRGCVVINVGRGNAVDEAALMAALRGGRIAGAYLDVFKDEPTQLAAVRGGGPVRRAQGLAWARTMPPRLVLSPHASAFSPLYLRMCFQELKDDGAI